MICKSTLFLASVLSIIEYELWLTIALSAKLTGRKRGECPLIVCLTSVWCIWCPWDNFSSHLVCRLFPQRWRRVVWIKLIGLCCELHLQPFRVHFNHKNIWKKKFSNNSSQENENTAFGSSNCNWWFPNSVIHRSRQWKSTITTKQFPV